MCRGLRIVDMEHGMVTELMGEGHERRRAPQPDGPVDGKSTPPSGLPFGDFDFAKKVDPSTSRPFAGTGVRGPTGVQLQPWFRDTEIPACERNQLRNRIGGNCIPVEVEQHIGIP